MQTLPAKYKGGRLVKICSCSKTAKGPEGIGKRNLVICPRCIENTQTPRIIQQLKPNQMPNQL